jgi:hAT family C-terminal dimerisation region
LFSTQFGEEESTECYGVKTRGDEVECFLSMGIVTSTTFIDVVQWWAARKEVLPAHYQMSCDYLGIPAMSTSCDRANSAAGRCFSSTRQSLSTTVFIKTILLRSWMKAGFLAVPQNRAQAAAALVKSLGEQEKDVSAEVDEIECDEHEWDDEFMESGVADNLNTMLGRGLTDMTFT